MMPAIQEYWKSGGLNPREEETKAVFQTQSGGGSGGWCGGRKIIKG